MTDAEFFKDLSDPLNFATRTFKAHRDMQVLIEERVKSVSGNLDALLDLLSDTQSKHRVQPDEKLHLCRSIWNHFPEKRKIVAAVALNALAEAFDADIARAEALKEMIPDFEKNEELKKSLKKIRAISRAKQKYYVRTRYQATDANRLKTQIFKSTDRPLPADALFICIGSCFASNIGTALMKRGIEKLYAIRYHDDADPLSILSGVMRNETFKKDVVDSPSCVIILTAGFAEAGGGTFLTPEQVSEVIIEMNTTLKAWNPSVRFFVTVSPVPLRGTSSGLSAYEANSISKAIVRLGVEQARKAGVEYYPSYELITQHFSALGICPVGVDDGTPNHVNRDAVQFVTDLFIDHYLPHLEVKSGLLKTVSIPVRSIGPNVTEREELDIEYAD